LVWLVRHHGPHVDPEQVALGRRAFRRCLDEVMERLLRFDTVLAALKQGVYAPHVRAASLLLDRGGESPAPQLPASTIARPLALLVSVEPTLASVPQPHVVGGQLFEVYWTLTEADRAALESALRLRDQSAAGVAITVAAVGPRVCLGALREVLSLG